MTNHNIKKLLYQLILSDYTELIVLTMLQYIICEAVIHCYLSWKMCLIKTHQALNHMH